MNVILARHVVGTWLIFAYGPVVGVDVNLIAVDTGTWKRNVAQETVLDIRFESPK